MVIWLYLIQAAKFQVKPMLLCCCWWYDSVNIVDGVEGGIWILKPVKCKVLRRNPGNTFNHWLYGRQGKLSLTYWHFDVLAIRCYALESAWNFALDPESSSNSSICGCCQVEVVDFLQHRAAYFIHAAFKNPKLNFSSLKRTTTPPHYIWQTLSQVILSYTVVNKISFRLNNFPMPPARHKSPEEKYITVY